MLAGEAWVMESVSKSKFVPVRNLMVSPVPSVSSLRSSSALEAAISAAAITHSQTHLTTPCLSTHPGSQCRSHIALGSAMSGRPWSPWGTHLESSSSVLRSSIHTGSTGPSKTIQ